MKTLLVDIGNSAIKSISVDGGYSNLTGGAIERMTLEHLLERDFTAFGQIMVSSVASHESLQRISDKAKKNDTRLFISNVDVNRDQLMTRYDETALGVDRWLAMLGARVLAQADGELNGFIVIDAGSAITVDVVDLRKGHLGGQIIAGRSLLNRALHMPPKILSAIQGKLEDDETRHDKEPLSQLLGQNTFECVTLGVKTSLMAILPLLQQLVNYTAFRCYFCGGDGEELIQLCNDSVAAPLVYDEYLVFKGMLEQLNVVND